ncbi:MFS transporter [Jannaschia sp. Os4]|uniref:MFS transporter n=1 Tax=Jannaschia sp. Os4 TaxID=2807617 RepID=UPI001939387B|nr:MFS transporter [Jannaschia sp. Os4]MBM2575293.1 MFS transporter [Jannaschia sp. Os4]
MPTPAARTVARLPTFKLLSSLLFAQATWFLYFQDVLSAAEAVLLYVVADLATTILEVPSGWMSDRLGRRPTLLAAAATGAAGSLVIVLADAFPLFALGQILLGASGALVSGTDSSALYEALAAEGREEEVERHELRMWRAGFTGYALSAVTGGAMALADGRLPFLAGSLAMLAALVVALGFHDAPARQVSEKARLREIGTALNHPVLRWTFALALLMYAFSHVPFVFGQPFVLASLEGTGWGSEAPLVSGAVTTAMMLTSVAASWIAQPLRDRIGLAPTLLLGFGIQVALAAAMAWTIGPWAIPLLLLRMVPDAFSRPFLLARIQPLLGPSSRATYLSIQSLAGRVLLAGTLLVAAGSTTGAADLPVDDLRAILLAYATLGTALWLGLALWAARVRP